MNPQTIICIVIQVSLIQSISSQLIGAYNGILADGYTAPLVGPLLSPCGAVLGPIAAQLGPLAAPIGPLSAPIAPIASPIACAAPIVADWAGLAPATYGGSFAVSSFSPITPTGISVASENAYDGVLTVTGQLPFLSAVALEGTLATAGAGVVTYGCGNGNVAILNEDLGYPEPYGYGPLGYGGPVGYGGPIGYGGPVGYGGPIGYGGLGLNGFSGLGCGLY